MDGKVIVTAIGKDVVVVSRNNPAYGHIRVKQRRLIVSSSGHGKLKEYTSLMSGTVKDLRQLGWVKDQEIEGKIIIKEQTFPFNNNKPEKDIKLAGEGSVPCKLQGKIIYRKLVYCQDPEAKDVFVIHDNMDEIKKAYANRKKRQTLNNL